MSDNDKIAACLVAFFAKLHFVEDRENDVWWYKWCIEHGARARHLLLSATWWALRREDKEPDTDWLGYVLDYRKVMR
jgi:hypothetical protein